MAPRIEDMTQTSGFTYTTTSLAYFDSQPTKLKRGSIIIVSS